MLEVATSCTACPAFCGAGWLLDWHSSELSCDLTALFNDSHTSKGIALRHLSHSKTVHKQHFHTRPSKL